MKTILVRGPLLTNSGYGVHSRQVFRWALEQEKHGHRVVCHCLPWGITPWKLNADDEGGLVGEIMQRSVAENEAVNADLSVQVQLPNEWNPSVARHNVGISACVETDRANPEWITACNRMTEVVVPSRHARNSLENAGKLSKPVNVVPEAFHPDFLLDASDLEGSPELELVERSLADVTTQTNFLVMGQMTGDAPETDRKNLFNTIKWFIEEFKGDESVGLIVKTNSGKNTTIDRRVTRTRLRNFTNSVRARHDEKQFPKVYLLHGNMSEKELSLLYRHDKVDCLLSATRGEGFGLPILEATVCGLPVMVTDWSAHTEYLAVGRYLSVKYQLKPVHKSKVDGRIFVQGSRWAEVDEEHLKSRMRKFVESPVAPRQWAQELSGKLRESHSIESEISNLNEVLSKYLE